MSRTSRVRLLASCLGLWFLVAGGEPPFAHPCEMGAEGAAHSSHGAPTDHDAEHAEHDASGDPDTSLRLCECVDCGTPATQAAAPVASVGAPVRSVAVTRPPDTGAARATYVAPRLLPFANGPPATTLS